MAVGDGDGDDPVHVDRRRCASITGIGAILWRVVAGMAPGIIVGSLAGPQIVGGMSTAAACGVLRRVRRGRGHADAARPQAEADARAARQGRAVRGRRRHRTRLEHGRRRRRVPVGAVHDARATCRSATASRRRRRSDCRSPSRARSDSSSPDWRRPGLPPHTIGYVYVPALLAIVAASVVSAPFGARAAHRWPVQTLRRAFAFAPVRARGVHAVEGRSRRAHAGRRQPTVLRPRADAYFCRANRSRSTFFCTLPMALRGRSATKCTRFGTLKLAISLLERGDHARFGQRLCPAARRRSP